MNSIINPKLFSNTSLIYSDYNYNINIKGDSVSFNINSQIQDYNFKQEFQYYASAKSSWRFGFNGIHHTLTPNRFVGDANVFNKSARVGRSSLENALYVNNSYTVNSKLSVEGGLRLSSYTILGGDTYNLYDKGVKKDSVVLAKGAIGKTYTNPEPRFSISYQLNDKSSLKAAYARNTQQLHLLSNSTTTNPTDSWIGNSYNIKPEIADQMSAGYFRNFKDNSYEFSVEAYYKDMQNQVDFKNGADINTVPDVESELLFGVGRAYGLELLFKKKTGKFTGWVSYTLSKTERKIEGINNNNWYNAKQDRRHDLAVIGTYQVNQKWSVASNFVLYTGNAVTFPTGKYVVDSKTVFLYGERNSNRMPIYHRLDFSVNYEGNNKKKWHGSWNFGLYNAYGRQNAYSIDFKDDPNDASKTQVVKTSLFRWVPSITYNFKF